MIVYSCKACKSKFLLNAEDSNIGLLKRNMRCPNNAQCSGRIIAIKRYNAVEMQMKAQRLSAIELYQATLGIGLPNERECVPKNLLKMCKGQKIVSIHLEAAPDGRRSLIHSFTLENGKTLHFATSTKGATIFKVTEEAVYVR